MCCTNVMYLLNVWPYGYLILEFYKKQIVGKLQ